MAYFSGHYITNPNSTQFYKGNPSKLPQQWSKPWPHIPLYWLLNSDPYNGLLQSPDIWVVKLPIYSKSPIEKQPVDLGQGANINLWRFNHQHWHDIRRCSFRIAGCWGLLQYIMFPINHHTNRWATFKHPYDIPLYWLGNRDPYNGLQNNPHITG